MAHPRLVEYGDVLAGRAPRSDVTQHGEAFSARVRAVVQLVSATAGYEPAGAAMRWTDGFWAVWWEAHGARQGQRFLTEAPARERFAALTSGAA